MHRFFAQLLPGGRALLPADEAQHAYRVLRLPPGERVALLCGETLYEARLWQNAEAEILCELPSTEPETRVTLYQGVPKGDKMDYIAQKCTEAGVYRIVPVRMARCVREGDLGKKLERWNRIAREAAKQSFRARAPEIAPPISVCELAQALGAHTLALVPWEDARGRSVSGALALAPDARDIAIVIGPEGGMEAGEVAQMTGAGAHAVTLGPRILRTETAGLAAAIAIFALKGDME